MPKNNLFSARIAKVGLAAVNMADYISGMLSKSLGVLAVEATTFSALTSSTYGIASMFFLMPDPQNQREQPHM